VQDWFVVEFMLASFLASNDKKTLVDLPGGGGAKAAEYMAACNTIPINFEGINCLDTSAVEDAQ
jgi:hypothetical protein